MWTSAVRSILRAACFSVVCGGSVVCTAANQYEPPVWLSVPGAYRTEVRDVAADGAAVGVANFTDGFNYWTRGFVYRDDEYTLLLPPGASSARATGITDDGLIVGSYEAGSRINPTRLGFLFDGQAYSIFAPQGQTTLTYIDGVSSDGHYVAGSYGSQSGYVFDRWNGVFTRIPRTGYTYVTGVNGAGDVVGYGFSHGTAFRYSMSDGSFEALSPFGAVAVYPKDINDHGQIAGVFISPTTSFIGSPAAGWTTFALSGSDPSGEVWVEGVNEQGVVYGYASVIVGGGPSDLGFIARPVPEAPSWAMALVGLGVAGWWRSRQRAPVSG